MGRLLTYLDRPAEAETVLTRALDELPQDAPQRPAVVEMLDMLRA